MLQLDDFQGRLGRPVRDPNLQDEPLDLETKNQADLYQTALNFESENDESSKPDDLTQILELYNDRLKKNQEYLENELKNQNNQEFKQIFLQIVKREYQLLNNVNQNEDDFQIFGINYRYLEMIRIINNTRSTDEDYNIFLLKIAVSINQISFLLDPQIFKLIIEFFSSMKQEKINPQTTQESILYLQQHENENIEILFQSQENFNQRNDSEKTNFEFIQKINQIAQKGLQIIFQQEQNINGQFTDSEESNDNLNEYSQTNY